MNKERTDYRESLRGKCQMCSCTVSEILQLDHCHTREIARGHAFAVADGVVYDFTRPGPWRRIRKIYKVEMV